MEVSPDTFVFGRNTDTHTHMKRSYQNQWTDDVSARFAVELRKNCPPGTKVTKAILLKSQKVLNPYYHRDWETGVCPRSLSAMLGFPNCLGLKYLLGREFDKHGFIEAYRDTPSILEHRLKIRTAQVSEEPLVDLESPSDDTGGETTTDLGEFLKARRDEAEPEVELEADHQVISPLEEFLNEMEKKFWDAYQPGMTNDQVIRRVALATVNDMARAAAPEPFHNGAPRKKSFRIALFGWLPSQAAHIQAKVQARLSDSVKIRWMVPDKKFVESWTNVDVVNLGADFNYASKFRGHMKLVKGASQPKHYRPFMTGSISACVDAACEDLRKAGVSVKETSDTV